MQDQVVKSHSHLRDAAIPVQDLHLTLFVATLHEEDNSLQVQFKGHTVLISNVYARQYSAARKL